MALHNRPWVSTGLDSTFWNLPNIPRVAGVAISTSKPDLPECRRRPPLANQRPTSRATDVLTIAIREWF